MTPITVYVVYLIIRVIQRTLIIVSPEDCLLVQSILQNIYEKLTANPMTKTSVLCRAVNLPLTTTELYPPNPVRLLVDILIDRNEYHVWSPNPPEVPIPVPVRVPYSPEPLPEIYSPFPSNEVPEVPQPIPVFDLVGSGSKISKPEIEIEISDVPFEASEALSVSQETPFVT